MRQDGKRPDGTTILPWSRGRPLAWDVTVPDTYADSHVVNTAREAGAAANHAATNKNTKYSQLAVLGVLVCSFRWPLRQGIHGTIRRWNWYRRLEDGRPTLQAMLRVHLPVPSAVRGITEGGNAVPFQNRFTTS